ncbi:MAG: bifunctional 4-hydroxy-3-methylbut-2-enyl diphosphate reductase/30S ribosomal protein S1 [Oscillospiraceae bacterium]|nr:bifunctional 4-hydroxy-3-methylbut-2-enyl diphosphate reductase/30S ribosomal protein S1 [Oscillospiraceae bacterium]
MKVILAKSAGFCRGVERAVALAERTAKERGGAMLGSLIHNDAVIRELETLGMRRISSPDEAAAGEAVLIRSHGERREVLDALKARGAEIVDATCPHVQRAQRLVEQAAREGAQALIVGEASHPEVVAVASRCPGAAVCASPAETAAWLESDYDPDRPVLAVAQTTCIRSVWENCLKILKKECTNVKSCDTICGATQRRQLEAAEIAARVDVMVVVGDRKSSNTRHLTEICQEACPRVVQIETADELSPDVFSGCMTAGLTAGASTPASIMKEVYATMTEEIRNEENQVEETAPVEAPVPEKREIAESDTFEEMLEKSFKTLNTGDKVTGVVTAIGATEIQVDLGCKQAGYIPITELSADPDAKVEDIVHVGDEIETYIVRVNDVEGYATLSKKRLDAVKVWEDIEKAVEEKTVLEGTVTEINKGGVVVSVKGVRVFVPASQSGQPRDADLSAMVKETVKLRITEVNRARRRVVGSIRSVLNEARAAAQKEVWDNIEVGKHYDGVVKSMTSYGVFVDIGGVDGMVHISELSWSRIKHPSEIVKVGDRLDVYVISFDAEKHKISLGVKDRTQNPWDVFMKTYQVGDVAKVRIVKLMTFGAFAEVVPGVDGLIHISQIADRRIEKPGDVLTEGETVEAKITAVDEEKQKISLSIRAILTPAPLYEDEEDEAPAAEEASEAPAEE